MVEHAWVRIAELKAEAEAEAWQEAHPRLARLRKQLRYLYVRYLNWLKDFRESENGQHLAERVQHLKAAALRAYLVMTRLGGCRPRRARVLHLSTRQLISELDARAIDHDDCIERRELLDALCGEADESYDDALDELVPPSPVDKVV